MSEFALFLRYARNCLRAQMLYPNAFLIRMIAQFVITLTEFGGLFALFARFGHIKGWSFPEVAVFYGVVSTAFSLCDMSARGFEMLGPQFIKTGDFDRVLLRPRSATVQLAGFEFGFTSVGRLAQGVIATIVALSLLHVDWSLAKAALLLWSVAGGFALFYGILILQGTMAFWTIESLEIANTLTYGGVEAAQYPLDVYAAWFRRFLIFVVPMGCTIYYPVATFLGRTDATGIPAWAGALAPAAGFLFLGIAFAAWGRGIAHYTSTGS
jgi:viologen exporter family transport system permease protein